jgi:hypothetical protein
LRRSLKVKIFSSFFSNSALCGPTPLRYSIGLFNMSVFAGIIPFEQMYYSVSRLVYSLDLKEDTKKNKNAHNSFYFYRSILYPNKDQSQ